MPSSRARCSAGGRQDLEPIQPGDPRYAALEVTLPEYHETLRPTHVVREFTPKDPNHPWMMLVRVLPVGTEMDQVAATDDRHWQATPHAKFERLLRETQVPIGLLVSDSQIRLVYAPRGETSGFATFNVAEMVQVAGRPIFAALHMLLCEERLFSLGEKQRLPAILADSRKYQNVVSTKLAQQVMAALFELVRGFQAADDQAKGELLRDVLAADPNHVYHGLLTVLMRLVFILYAEDRGLLSNDSVYVNYYAVTGLFDRLRADAGRFPDTMDLRYGAWAQLLTLFRLIYEGGSHGGLQIPARRGYLFDPDRYNFLEGRAREHDRRTSRTMTMDRGPHRIPSHVSDGVIFRVLNNLLILDGERLSYRTLDVEQIGSVYEAIMGFNLEVARGPSIAIKPKKAHGAPASINLEELLATKPADRPKWLKDQTDQALTGQALDALKKAATDRRPAGGAGEANRARGHPERRLQGGDGPATLRRAPPERLALHAAISDRTDRPDDAQADPRPVRRSGDARADPGPEGLRSGNGLRRVPGRSLPAARRCAGQGLARAR